MSDEKHKTLNCHGGCGDTWVVSARVRANGFLCIPCQNVIKARGESVVDFLRSK